MFNNLTVFLLSITFQLGRKRVIISENFQVLNIVQNKFLCFFQIQVPTMLQENHPRE